MTMDLTMDLFNSLPIVNAWGGLLTCTRAIVMTVHCACVGSVSITLRRIFEGDSLHRVRTLFLIQQSQERLLRHCVRTAQIPMPHSASAAMAIDQYAVFAGQVLGHTQNQPCPFVSVATRLLPTPTTGRSVLESQQLFRLAEMVYQIRPEDHEPEYYRWVRSAVTFTMTIQWSRRA